MRGSYFRAIARLVFVLGMSGALGIFGGIATPLAQAQAQPCVKYLTPRQTTSIPQSPDFDSYGEAASWVLEQYNAHSINSTWELAPWSTVAPDGFAIAEYTRPGHTYNGYLNIAIWTRPCPLTISLSGAGSTHAMKAGPVVDMLAIVTGGAAQGTAVSISLNGSAALSGTTDASGVFKFKYIPPETAASAHITASCTSCSNTASHDIKVYGARLPDMCPRDPGSLLGNPIVPSTGEKIQTEQDWQDAGAHPLGISRGYRSYGNVDAGMGPNWSHSYNASLVAEAGGWRSVRLGEGTTIVFRQDGAGAWLADNGKDRLIDTAGVTTYVRASDESRWAFDASGGALNGRLLSITQRNGWATTMTYTGLQLTGVTNAFGRTLQLAYNGAGKLASITPSGAGAITYGYDTAGRLASVTYQDGATRRYVYEDARWPNALTGIVDETGQRYASFGYDASGRATGTSHALGAQYFSMAYDTAAGGPPGGSLSGAATLDPDIYRATTQATNPLGQLQTYTYQGGDGTLRLLSASGPFDGAWFSQRTFTGPNLPATEIDFLGITTRYSWDAERQLKLSTTKAVGRPEAQTTGTQWHTVYRLPTLITEAGRSTAYTYDAAGNKLTETVTDTASGQSRATQWTYTTGGLPDTMTDAGGGVWRYGYDAQGNRTTVKNPLNQQSSYRHGGAGRVTQDTAPNGLITAYTYDARGRLLSRNAGGETSTYTYNARGLLASAQMPNGYLVTYNYDAAQRLTGATDNRGNSTVYTLDAAGNRTQEERRDAANNIALATSTVINSLNQVSAIKGAAGQTTAFGYDANGEPISQTDPLAHTTSQTLDGLRRTTATTFADGNAARQAWSQLDQLTALIDPKGVQTSYQTNAFGNTVRETSPDIGTVLYEHDAMGRVTKRTDARGNITTWARDALGRPTQVDHGGSQVINYSWDGAGQTGYLSGVQDKSGSTSYVRDRLGRITAKTQAVNDNPASPSSFTTSYSFAGGDLAGITYASGLKVTYRRDATGQIIGIDTQAPGRNKPVTAFVNGLAWTALGAPKSWSWNNGDMASRRFDTDGRMHSNEFASYTYDAASRITGITQNLYALDPGFTSGGETSPPTVYPTPLAFTAGYDSRNRLTSLTRGGAQTRYSYDANSNRLTALDKTTSDTDLDGDFDDADFVRSTSQSLAVDAASNKLQGFTQTVITTKAGTTKSTVVTPVSYTLDANGALTSDGLRTFEYDASSRLATVKLTKDGEAASVNYLYNAMGQRVFKSEIQAAQTLPSETTLGTGFVEWLRSRFQWMFARDQASTSIGTAYSYGDGVLPEWAILGEYDNGSASGAGRTEYIWLPTPDGAIPVGMFRNGKLFAIHADHLGTPRLMTNDANAVVWQWPYSAFGNNKPTGILKATAKARQAITNQPETFKATAATEMNLRFPGQYYDVETRTHYNYFRHFDPKTGRYMQPDPIGLDGGINRFSYVGGNPLRYTDPLGLWRNPSDIYDDALRDARRSGLPGPHNGLQDAYRHCLASCEMTRENTEMAAQCLGWANEKRGDWWRNQEKGERQMDDLNNSTGFRFGRTAQNYQACQNSCMNAATTGGLRTYTPGTSPGYWY